MASLTKLAAARSPDEKTCLDREIKSTDAGIAPPWRPRWEPLRRGRAPLVYELYGLTAEEIAIVEGGRS